MEREKQVSRRSKLGITLSDIDRAYAFSAQFTNNSDRLSSYIRAVSQSLSAENPSLYHYLAAQKAESVVHDHVVFGFATSITYSMLPDEQRLLPLSPSQVAAAHQSLLEYKDVVNGKMDLRWYIDKIENDSEYYYAWLVETAKGLNSHDKQSDFLLGTTLVSLPFYLRSDAKELEKLFLK